MSAPFLHRESTDSLIHIVARKRKQESACENFTSGKTGKARRLRSDLEERDFATGRIHVTIRRLLLAWLVVQCVLQCSGIFELHF